MSPSTILRHAAADAEVREELLSDPASFGVSADTLPESVEQQDEKSLSYWTEGIATTEIYACETSCSFGRFTIICDGGTKQF